MKSSWHVDYESDPLWCLTAQVNSHCRIEQGVQARFSGQGGKKDRCRESAYVTVKMLSQVHKLVPTTVQPSIHGFLRDTVRLKYRFRDSLQSDHILLHQLCSLFVVFGHCQSGSPGVVSPFKLQDENKQSETYYSLAMDLLERIFVRRRSLPTFLDPFLRSSQEFWCGHRFQGPSPVRA